LGESIESIRSPASHLVVDADRTRDIIPISNNIST
jgi:hypothetical protein